jgi:hypothetical protein
VKEKNNFKRKKEFQARRSIGNVSIKDQISECKIRNKTGVSIWISWVMLVAFMVTLSTAMYYFFADYTKKSIDNIKSTVVDSKLCDNVGISATVCLKSTSELTINIKNVNYMTIDRLALDMFDVFDRPQQKSKEFNLVSGTQRQFDILKDGIIKEVHIVPVVYKDGKTIFCSNKDITVQNIESC